MTININNIAELLNSDLTVVQRGLLITMLLVKDTKPEYTLAKLKSTIKITEYNQDLITLHKAGYIKWSGYASAMKSENKKLEDPNVQKVISFMNNLYGRNYKADSLHSTKELRNRLMEHSTEDVMKVVANRYAEWKDDAVMEKHLNPTTIFRPSKFDKYMEEALRTHQGESFVMAQQINLKQGDELTFEMSDNILDKDVYTIKTYDVDNSGSRITSGMLSKVYGLQLKKMLKAQSLREARGDVKEFLYLYQEI